MIHKLFVRYTTFYPISERPIVQHFYFKFIHTGMLEHKVLAFNQCENFSSSTPILKPSNRDA